MEHGATFFTATVAPLAVFALFVAASFAEDAERTAAVRFTVTDAETGKPVKGCHVGVCRMSEIPDDPDALLPIEADAWTDESGVASAKLAEKTAGLDRIVAFTCHASYRNKVWLDAEFDRHLPLVRDARAAGVSPVDLTAGDASVALAITHVAETVEVTASDGMKLATELWLPDGDGPWPVILERTPYGRSVYFDGRRFTDAGYVYVVQDVRGRFDSEGSDLAFGGCGWFDHTDGKDTVEWIASQPWCNGNIATHGGSAMGITQNLLAGAYPAELDAQYILVASWGFYESVYQGGVFRKGLVQTWLEDHGFGPATIETIRAHPAYDDYWKERDPALRVSRMSYPAFHAGGWFDCFAQGTISAFVARQYDGAPQSRGRHKLLVGPWGHGLWYAEQVGEITFPNADDVPVPRDAVEWFDRQLKGVRNGFATAPAVTYYRMGDTSDPKAPGNDWRTADAWPVAATATPLYLHPKGALSRQRPTKADASASYLYDPDNPVPTLGGCNLNLPSGPCDQRSIEDRADVLLFTSEPLADPLEVTGRVKVILYATSDREDTDFTAKLTDVYPDGRSMLLADGIIRARYHRSLSEPELLEPGQVYELEIDLWSTSIVFNAGHRIRLAVSSSNAPRFEPNHNTAQLHDTPLAAHNTVLFDAEHPSRIVLPVVE